VVAEMMPVNKANYRLFEDMVYWRMTGHELTDAEKTASREQDIAPVLKELEHPDFYCYGALCEGRFVGWISMAYVPKVGPRWKKGMIYIDELWVAPEYRNRGIAKGLMEKAFECQRHVGAIEVRLYVGTDNAAAMNLYRNCGMKEAGPAIWMRSSDNETSQG
jgi:ribosomal protein S18 acetylase RimI-like enzyme